MELRLFASFLRPHVRSSLQLFNKPSGYRSALWPTDETNKGQLDV